MSHHGWYPHPTVVGAEAEWNGYRWTGNTRWCAAKPAETSFASIEVVQKDASHHPSDSPTKPKATTSLFDSASQVYLYFVLLSLFLLVGIIVVGLLAPPDVEGPFRWDESTNELSVEGMTVLFKDAEKIEVSERGRRIGLGWQTITPWDESVVSVGPLENFYVKHAIAYLEIPNNSSRTEKMLVGAGILYNEEDLQAETLEEIYEPSLEIINSEIFERTSGERTCTVKYNDYEFVSGGGQRTEAFVFVDDPTLPPLVFAIDGQSTQKLDAVFDDLIEQTC